MDWKKALLLAGGAAGACAVLYYLLEADADSSAHIVVDRQVIDPKKDTKVDGISKEQVQQILQEIIQSQAIMKLYMKNFTKELLSTKLSFEEAYKRVKEVQPSDPLEKHGLSMMDFDQLLDKHQNDPSVSAALSDIVGAPVPSSSYNKSITVKEILSIHHFMLEELEKLVSYIEGMQDRSSYDMKTMTITAQAIVGSKVEAKFHITSEEIETAVLNHHTVLAVDQDFSNVNVKIQKTMGKLMGADFAA
eukprot:TRINITY_DN106_c0_g1_i3.p1 TRINITY_DN106_c0_g1~~TRINITY_DN106_c0_g1_i3.p1  ORF type:complete len:248 (+),score=61.01 TRINITY_DN106_c0_g1_i3:81-824(+)